MERLVDIISLVYGDTKISFFGIKINDLSDLSSVWHRHNYYELHYCTDKQRKYDFSEKSICFNNDEIVIIPPNVNHKTVADFDVSKNPPATLAFTVSKIKGDILFYDKVIVALEENSLKPLVIPEISSEDIFVFQNISLYESFLGICQLKSVASGIIYHIFNHMLSDTTLVKRNDESVTVLIDNLVNNLQYTFQDIAKITGYSQRQLSRIIKKHYGLSFTELRRKMKEEK
ncbi:MAG: AraC family transcriptional regulator [Ruminococcaceae bacterium]|nr:AraC family transcriptional regulator [Oscillospiraceae bacterium]